MRGDRCEDGGVSVRHMPKWARFAGLLMLLALVMTLVAACGDDGEDEPEADTGITTTEPAGGAETSPTSEEAEEAEGTEDAGAVETEVEDDTVAEEASPDAEDEDATPGVEEEGLGRVEGGDLTFGQTFDEPESTGGTLIEGSISDISTVMPVVTDDDASFDFQSLIFESLITVNPFTLEPVGLLAESWESNEDASQWTLNLREGVTWHDGEPFTAEDVKFTYELHMNEATGSSYTADLSSKIESIEVIDDQTVQFNLTGPLPDFLVDVAVYGIVAEHIWGDVDPAAVKQDPGATGTDPSRVVGTGPFQFVEWITGDNARAEKYADYWQAEPILDEYIYKVVPDQAAGAQQLQTGEIDFMQGLPPTSVAEFEGTDVEVVAADRLSFTFFGFNLDPERNSVFQDQNVRQALLYSLDREAMVEEIQGGFGQVAIGTMPPLSWAYNPDGIEMTYPYDPDQAMQLLEDAGWTDTDGDGVREKDGQRLSFTMYTNAGNNVREQYLVAMQQYWAEIGVEMTPQLEPFPELVDRVTETHDFDIFLLGFGWSAGPDQSAMFACDSYEGGFNFGRYCNEEVDAILAEANSIPDQDERVELYTQFQNIVMEELPVAILDFPQMPTGVNNRVHNIFPSDINVYWNVHTWWVEE